MQPHGCPHCYEIIKQIEAGETPEKEIYVTESWFAAEDNVAKVYPEIDMVTPPPGKPVAMVHCNNCTNEINAWAEVFKGFLTALGQTPDMNQVFTAMFTSALQGGGRRRWAAAVQLPLR